MADFDLMRRKCKHRDGVIHLLDQSFVQNNDLNFFLTFVKQSLCSKEDDVCLSVAIINLYADDLLSARGDVAGDQCLVWFVVVEVEWVLSSSELLRNLDDFLVLIIASMSFDLFINSGPDGFLLVT